MKKEQEIIYKIIKTSVICHNINKLSEKVLGLSLVQYHLLAIIRDCPNYSHQQIAKMAGLSPATLTQSLKRLSKKNYIAINNDPGDSRRKMILLLAKGNQSVASFEKGVKNFLRDNLDSWPI